MMVFALMVPRSGGQAPALRLARHSGVPRNLGDVSLPSNPNVPHFALSARKENGIPKIPDFRP